MEQIPKTDCHLDFRFFHREASERLPCAVGCGLWAVGCGLWAVGGFGCSALFVRWSGLESEMLIARFRIRLNITNLARKINYQCRSGNLSLGGPVRAGDLPLKVSRQPSRHIYVPRSVRRGPAVCVLAGGRPAGVSNCLTLPDPLIFFWLICPCDVDRPNETSTD
jgi:hypothetical protein